jgi:hypothetical protein
VVISENSERDLILPSDGPGRLGGSLASERRLAQDLRTVGLL